MKYCKDCKFFRPFKLNLELSDCSYPLETPPPSPVTGEPDETFTRHCRVERMFEDADRCGSDAKWFQPKLEIVA